MPLSIEGSWNGRTHIHQVHDETKSMEDPSNREFCEHCDRRSLPVAIVRRRRRSQ